jgi:hypothetical protein
MVSRRKEEGRSNGMSLFSSLLSCPRGRFFTTDALLSHQSHNMRSICSVESVMGHREREREREERGRREPIESGIIDSYKRFQRKIV